MLMTSLDDQIPKVKLKKLVINNTQYQHKPFLNSSIQYNLTNQTASPIPIKSEGSSKVLLRSRNTKKDSTLLERRRPLSINGNLRKRVKWTF